MDRPKRIAIVLASKSWLVFILLFLAGFAAYYTALDGKFLYDDSWLVGGNPFFKSPIFIFEVFKHYLFLDSLSFYYRPVQNISYMLDYWLWFSNEFGYHLSNICYHVLAAFLLYLLLKALLPGLASAADWRDEEGDQPPAANNIIAFIVALVWVVHPIHNAAVAYVAGRADSLACDFAISAWLLYIAAGRCRAAWAKPLVYVLAMFCFLMGLCSKEIAMVWLPLFFVHLFFFNKEKSLRQKFSGTLGVALVMGCYYFLHHLPGGASVPVSAGTDSFALRVVKMLRALGDYTWLVFYPDNLHMDRYVLPLGTTPSLTHWDFHNRLEYLSTIGVVMILVFIVMGIARLPGRRLRIFSIVWFLSGFLPISNLFPLNAQVAEHWIYMPSMGILLFFAGCVLAMPRPSHAFLAVIALLSVAPFAWRTSLRAYEWADQERFFKATIDSGGGSSRINLNLAMVYYNAGDYAKAEAMMRNIVKHDPSYIPARIDLGTTLLKERKDKEAEEFLNFDTRTAAQISTQFVHTWTAIISVAGIRLKEHKYDEALAMADDAMKLYPGIWEVAQFKAMVLVQMGSMPEAVAVLKEYTASHWWHYQSFITLAWLSARTGDSPGAIAEYRHAALLDIHAGDPWFKIAQVDLTLNKPQEALVAQLKGLARNPDLPLQYIVLSGILDQLGRTDEARVAFARAGELQRSVRPRAETSDTTLLPQ